MERELHEIDRLAVAYTVDEDAKAGGLLRLTLKWDVPDFGIVDLVATFPDLYPYFRPEVRAPDLSLAHHQNPFAKNLCLIGRATENWDTTDTLAGLLSSKLPATIAAGSADPPPGPEREALDEERQAEPFSDYYSYAPGAIFLIDGAWHIPDDSRCGTFGLKINGALRLGDSPHEHVIGAVTGVADDAGCTLAEAADSLTDRFPNGPIRGRWARLDAPVMSNQAKDLWDAAAAVDLLEPPRQQLADGRRVQIRALLFPEEVDWRACGDGWAFVVREPGVPINQRRLSKKARGRGRANLPQTPAASYWIVRAGRAGRSDLAERVPALAGIADKAAAVVGTGALGGTIADQLARAGLGRLHTLDPQDLDPGNTVRHSAYLDQSGWPKAGSVAGNAVRRSPYTVVDCAVVPLGLIRERADQPSDADALDKMLDGVDLLIDASAEFAVHHLLSDEARRRGLPYLRVTATQGGWGGMVVLVTPDTDGCWFCLMHHIADKTILNPPADPGGAIQPAGCADPTFTGTGFDLDQVSLHAVRVAVAALLRETSGGYPAPPGDVAVLALRDPDGTPMLPTWTSYPLVRHPDCPCH